MQKESPLSSFSQGPAGVDAYRRFVDLADTLAAPLIELMQPGQSSLPIEGRASEHGEEADRLEAFARPLLLLCLWLHGRRKIGLGDERDTRVTAWIHDAMKLGATPDTPTYWGTLTNYHQHAVEFAIIAMSLEIAHDEVWETADAKTRERFLAYFSQIRGHGGHRNNHLFFDVLCLEFLHRHDASALGDDRAIEHHLDELEAMHRGDGWFIDGGNESYDHYNAYAFHIYGLWWASRYGGRDPERARRWIRLAEQFLPAYATLFGASGEPVPIGRSLTYRFNGVGVFAVAAACGVDTVDPGASRRLSRRCIEFFLDQPIEQSQGCLSVGWTNPFDEMAEPYTCAGSPYWAAKGLLALSLSPDDRFFTAPEAPFPAEQTLEGTDSTTVIGTPGWVVRLRDGHATLINAGGSSSMSAMKRFGAWKWGKLLYRTGIGGLQCASELGEPIDNGLAARVPDTGQLVGRHNTIPVMVDATHAVCQYQLGAPYDDMNVSVCTHLWFVGDWYIALHAGRANQPTQLCHGAFAISDPTGSRCDRLEAEVANGDFCTRVVAICGFEEARVDQPRRRQHLLADTHAVPYLATGTIEGTYRAACAWSLSRCGSEQAFEVESLGDEAAVVNVDGRIVTLSSPHWRPVSHH